MHKVILTLLLCLRTVHSFTYEAAVDNIPSAYLLPGGFSALGDYEVLSIREEDDEDVVRIRKRAGQEECGSDCMEYSGWTEDRRMHCVDENETTNDVDDEEIGDECPAAPGRRSLFEKRAKKGMP